MPDGDSGARRLVRFNVHAPPRQSSMPAIAMLVHGLGHHRVGADIPIVPKRCERSGESSELGWIEMVPAQTMPPAFGLHAAKCSANPGQRIVSRSRAAPDRSDWVR